MKLCVGKFNSDPFDFWVHIQLLNSTSWGQRFILCNLNKKRLCHLTSHRRPVEHSGAVKKKKKKAHSRLQKPTLANGWAFIYPKRWFQSPLGKLTALATGKQPTSLLSSFYRASFIVLYVKRAEKRPWTSAWGNAEKMKHVRLPEGQKDQKVSSMGERAHGSNKQVAERYLWHWGWRGKGL